jgi:hypothetical protein
VGTDEQERGQSTALFCVWDPYKGGTSFVKSVESCYYVSLLFEGDLEISTVALVWPK